LSFFCLVLFFNVAVDAHAERILPDGEGEKDTHCSLVNDFLVNDVTCSLATLGLPPGSWVTVAKVGHKKSLLRFSPQ
jgi:hypothetical protein